MPKDLREAAWNEFDRSQCGDYSDVTHEQTFTAGFDAGAASVDRKAIVEALNSAASFASQYDDGDNAATRLIAKLDAVLETIGGRK